MIWLIPLLLFLLFLLFRFVKTHQEQEQQGQQEQQQQEDQKGGQRDHWWLQMNNNNNNKNKEGFQSLPMSDDFKQKYTTFSELYHAFLIRWRDTLVTAYQLEKEPGQATSTIPPDSTLNSLVTKLINEQGKPLPFLTDVLPPTVETLADLERVMDRIPKDSQPYFNALEWMNGVFLKAQKDVDAALQGGGIPSFEGFEGICSELSQCFKENPELIRELLKAQQEDEAQRMERIQRDLISRFEQFQQPRIQNAFELNKRLAKQAKEMQDKAQSGEWIKDVKMGGKDNGKKVSIPAGGNDLEELRKRDPAAYERLQQGNKSMFSLKQLFEQINGNLR